MKRPQKTQELERLLGVEIDAQVVRNSFDHLALQEVGLMSHLYF